MDDGGERYDQAQVVAKLEQRLKDDREKYERHYKGWEAATLKAEKAMKADHALKMLVQHDEIDALKEENAQITKVNLKMEAERNGNSDTR